MPGNNFTAFVPQVWSKKILKRLDQVNVALASGAVNKDYEGEIKKQGDTVWVRTFGNITMAPYVRGQGLSYQQLTPSKESLQVNDAQYFTFEVDDLDTAQNDINALDGYTDRAGVAMSNVVEEKCLSRYGSVPTANRITNSGNAITISSSNAYSSLVLAGKALDEQRVGTDGRWALVGPNYKASLLQDTTYFIRATDMGDALVRTGMGAKAANKLPNFLGQCAGFNLFLSTALPYDSNGFYAQFGAPGVISYAGQIRTIERIRLQDTFANAVRGLVLHDSKVFDEHAKAYGYILCAAA